MNPLIGLLVAFVLLVAESSQIAAQEPAWPDVRRVSFEGDAIVKKLPGTPSSMVPAAGGRLLVFRSETQPTVVVFDLNELKVHGTVPIPKRQTLVAAGREKLILVDPATGIAERWSLQTLKKETQQKLNVRLPIHGIALGAGASGPLLVVPSELISNESLAGMQLLNLRDFTSVVDSHLPNQKLFQDPSSYEFSPFASDDGSVFCCGRRPWQLRVVDRSALVARCEPQVYPGSFGQSFYGRASPLNSESNPLTEKPGTVQSTVGACGGPLYLQLARDARGALEANVCEEGELEPFGSVTLASAAQVPRGRIPTNWSFNIEFLPQSQVIANSASSANELALFRVDVEQMAKNSKVPVLTILSQPEPVRPGTEFRYILHCLGGNDGALFSLEYGPPGMNVTKSGVVSWSVPETFAAADRTIVAVRVRRGSKEIFHRFHLESADD